MDINVLQAIAGGCFVTLLYIAQQLRGMTEHIEKIRSLQSDTILAVKQTDNYKAYSTSIQIIRDDITNRIDELPENMFKEFMRPTMILAEKGLDYHGIEHHLEEIKTKLEELKNNT